MQDQRGASRYSTYLRGSVAFEDTTVECRVKDLSETGAKIDIDSPETLPNELLFEVPNRGLKVRAEVRWRYAHVAGLRFLAPSPAVGATASPTREELIAENDRLRVALKEFADRLARLGEKVAMPADV